MLMRRSIFRTPRRFLWQGDWCEQVLYEFQYFSSNTARLLLGRNRDNFASCF